jgi:hypothetical protein
VFYDNRAGSWDGYLVSGIGTLPNGYNGGINNWDMGSIDVVPSGTQPLLLAPTNSVIQTTQGYVASGTNTISSSPGFVSPFDLMVDILPSRTYPAFKQSLISGVLLPPGLTGDYHITAASPANNRATRTAKPAPWGSYSVSPPTLDIDGQTRPTFGGIDAGSDER